MEFIRLILFQIFFKLIFCIIPFKCGADSIKIKPHKIDEILNKRSLSDEDFRPLKIYLDYTYLKRQNKLKSEDLKTLMRLFDEINNYLSSLLSIIHFNSKIIKNDISYYCKINVYSDDILDYFNTYDIVIFPSINEELDEYILAQASACIILSRNSQPIAGIIEINRNFSLSKLDSEYYMKYILIHEISHVLGFGIKFFEDLGFLYTERKNGLTKDYLNSTKVIEKAKMHFNCNNIKGVELENFGGSGSALSHWEARYMLGDYMISTNYQEIAISDITLAYFEDTGIYKVNYYTGGLFRYGKNRGCSFLEQDCIYDDGEKTKFPNEFCTIPGEYVCGSSHISRGDCYIVKYYDLLDNRFTYYPDKYVGGFGPSDYCPISYRFYDENIDDLEKDYYYPFNCKYGVNIYEKIGEAIGEYSACFESSLVPQNLNIFLNFNYSICYEIKCNREKKEIIISIGDKNITCPKYETILTNPNGFTGKLKCPDYNMVCTSEIWCNELFDCIDKKSLSDLDTYTYNQNKAYFLGLNKLENIFKIILFFFL